VVTFSVRLTDCLVWSSRFDISSTLNPLSFPLFLAVMAWNIDYEHDSEEVILLKRQIAEQGSSRSVVHAPRLIAVLDNRYSTLQSQLIKAKAALDDNKETLDETTDKVCQTLPSA
jgi:hypothetical protein